MTDSNSLIIPTGMAGVDSQAGKIGVFDSGYGGLTILREICRELPQYQYLYLGDNARAPYGTRSFDVVFDFTRQAVETLFERGCRLVILACNTASAKALRSIQQNVLPASYPDRRVLGVIRPTVEILGQTSRSGHIGLLATQGTVRSHSYQMELEKLEPGMIITELACPMWVPLVETGEFESPGADYFVKKYIDEILAKDPEIDTLVLGCTHYPLLLPKIKRYVPDHIKILTQGEIVGPSLADYLYRHPEMERRCLRKTATTPQEEKGIVGPEAPLTGELQRNLEADIEFLTTENSKSFDKMASLFLGQPVISERITL